jgi:hypothetical protein
MLITPYITLKTLILSSLIVLLSACGSGSGGKKVTQNHAPTASNINYQNINSSAQLKGDDLTNWGADESQMDKAKMNSLIITAYPTTVTGYNYGELASNVFPTGANSGDIAQRSGEKFIYSGLENKWVKGYDLNDKTAKNPYEYLLPLRTIAEQAVKQGGATLYLPKGTYKNQIVFSQIYNNTTPNVLTNFRIIGDGPKKSIIDVSYLSDESKQRVGFAAIKLTANSDHITGFKNIIISDLGIKTVAKAIDILSGSKATGDNILVKNINIVKTSQSYHSLISFNRSLLMRLSRVTLDNVKTSAKLEKEGAVDGEGAYCMHEVAFFKGKYIKIRNSSFNANPAEFNIDTHVQFIEISNSTLTKTLVQKYDTEDKILKDAITARPNIKFPGSNYMLFNKVHFKSFSTTEGNILVSSSPEKYNLHFENCTFETPSKAIFTTYGHIGYGVEQLVLKDNKIIGEPSKFQIYGADKVYLNGNTKYGQAFNGIEPFIFNNYLNNRFTTDFKPLNQISKTFKSGNPIDQFIGYKSWNNDHTNNVIRDVSLLDTDVSINKNNVKVAATQDQLVELVASMNDLPNGGLIKIEDGNSFFVDNLILKKAGIIGKGKLTADNLSIIDEGYIGQGLTLKINNKITVNGSLVVSVANIIKPTKTGLVIEGKNKNTKIIIRASNLSGGETIISGVAHLVAINGESRFFDYEKSAVNITANFLNILDTEFENGEYGVFVDDIENLYLIRLSAINIQTPVYLNYHKHTKVIDISDIDINANRIPLVVNKDTQNSEGKLIDISIGRLKHEGTYYAWNKDSNKSNEVTFKTPDAKYAYAYNGVILKPITGKNYPDDNYQRGGGNTPTQHIPMGYFPAEWNYIHPNTPFPRPSPVDKDKIKAH